MPLQARWARWTCSLLAIVVIAVTGIVYYVPRSAPPPRPVANTAFTSAADPQSPAVVWAVGDGANGSDRSKAVARRIIADRPDRMLYLGDVYDNGSREEFQRNYDTVYGALADITAPTPGNHDWPAHRDGYDPYWRAQTGSPTPPWYVFDIGGWRVISLDSEAPHGEDSAQLRWLERQVQRRAGTCTLAIWHRPLQSAGDHGDQNDVKPLWNALRGHASLVLNGHDHTAQRLRPRDGITEIVAGAGGNRRYDVSGDDRVLFADDSHDSAVRIQLRPGRAALSFVSAAGVVLDRSTTTCVPATPSR